MENINIRDLSKLIYNENKKYYLISVIIMFLFIFYIFF